MGRRRRRVAEYHVERSPYGLRLVVIYDPPPDRQETPPVAPNVQASQA